MGNGSSGGSGEGSRRAAERAGRAASQRNRDSRTLGGSRGGGGRVKVTNVAAPGALSTMAKAVEQSKTFGAKAADTFIGPRSKTTIDTQRGTMATTRGISNLGLAGSLLGAVTGIPALGTVAGALDTESGVLGRTDVTTSTDLTGTTQANVAGRGDAVSRGSQRGGGAEPQTRRAAPTAKGIDLSKLGIKPALAQETAAPVEVDEATDQAKGVLARRGSRRFGKTLLGG